MNTLEPGLDAALAAELERVFENPTRSTVPGAAELRQYRRAALDAFKAKGFPSRRNEAWKYTDLKPIAAGGFDFAPAAKRSADRDEAIERILGSADARSLRAVFVDGRLDRRLSLLTLPVGLEAASLVDEPERFTAFLAASPALKGHPLAALNTAFATQGLALHAAPGIEQTEVLHLYFLGSASGLAEQPRICIELGTQAALNVVVHCLDAERSAASWLNLVIQVSLAEGARLSLYRMQEHGPAFFETSLLSAKLAKDASLDVGYVDLGGRLVRNDIDVALCETGARVSLFGVFIAAQGRHVDNHTKIDHLAPDTLSEEAFRGIADKDGHGVFNGRVIVHPGAERIRAHQVSDNLLLAERAEIDTKPELEIYADDVQCSHGATVGELDEEQLFYLRARGIAEQSARDLLTFAFAGSLLERLPSALRESAAARVLRQLPGGASPGFSIQDRP